MYRVPSPTRTKAMNAKRLILRRTQNHFRRACDQIVLLNRRMEGVLYRYHAARARGNRSFRYKLRLRLAIVEGVRNMFYEYANRKAFEIVNLRRDLFGEIVEIVSDDVAANRMYSGDVDSDVEDGDDSELDLSYSDEEENAAIDTEEMEIDVDVTP